MEMSHIFSVKFTEIEVLFFNEEQLDHGDEPYTYTYLT